MKKLAALFLLTVLLLVGCAQKQEDPAIISTVAGKWLYAEDATGPVWIELLPDGACNLSSGEQYRWKGISRQPDGTCSIELLRDGKRVYAMHILADSALLEDEGANEAGSYTRVVYAPEGAAAQWFTDWYPLEGAAAQAVSLGADGVCVLDEKRCEWTAVAWGKESTRLLCFDNVGIVGWLQINQLPSGIASLVLTDESGVALGAYYTEALLPILLGQWQPFSEEHLPMLFSSRNVELDHVSHPWEFLSAENGVLTLSLSVNAQAYTIHVWMEGEYPRMELEGGEENVLYYRADRGYAPDDPEALYRKTMKDMTEYQQTGGFAQLQGNAARADLYARLEALSGYRDADSYFARFTRLVNKLTRVVELSKDASGRISENILELYTYDASDRLISGRGKTLEETYAISSHITVGTMYFSYDESGRVSAIRVGTEDTTAATCTPSYNSKGNLSSMHIVAEDLTLTASFAYNSKNLCTSYRIPYTAYDETYYGYTYNSAGQCIKKTVKWAVYGYTEVSTYIYSESGILEQETVVKTISYPDMTRKTTTTYRYTCDESGAIISAAVTTDDPAVTYVEQQIQYIYEDLYFYDPA